MVIFDKVLHQVLNLNLNVTPGYTGSGSNRILNNFGEPSTAIVSDRDAIEDAIEDAKQASLCVPFELGLLVLVTTS